MALYFEDFVVGEEYVTPARTVTEHDVMAFAGLTGDYNPLHTDVEHCKGTLYGKPVAHGLLGLSITSGLISRLGLTDGTTLAFLGLTWKFTGPIFFGDTIKVHITVAEKRETSKKDRGIIIRGVKLVNQRGEVVQEGQHTLLIRRKAE
jgi:acyl dehydratase